MCLPIIVQLLHSIQALPDSSGKVGPVSLTFQTKKKRPNGLSFNGKTNGWQTKLSNRNTSPKLRKTVSIPEVILQSTFTSFSKQKRVNAHGHNPATRYFDNEMSGAYIAEGLLYLAVPIARLK